MNPFFLLLALGIVVFIVFLILIHIRVLCRAFADTRGDLRILSLWHVITDRQHRNLMPPIVSEIEPIAELILLLESQRVDPRFIGRAGRKRGSTRWDNIALGARVNR